MPKYAYVHEIDPTEKVGTRRWQKIHPARVRKLSRLRLAHKKKPHSAVTSFRKSLGRKSSADLTTKEVLVLAGEKKPDLSIKLRQGLTKAKRIVGLGESMPNPQSGESVADFVARFVNSEEAKRSFPDKKQRLAVAYSKARQRKGLKESFLRKPHSPEVEKAMYGKGGLWWGSSGKKIKPLVKYGIPGAVTVGSLGTLAYLSRKKRKRKVKESFSQKMRRRHLREALQEGWATRLVRAATRHGTKASPHIGPSSGTAIASDIGRMGGSTVHAARKKNAEALASLAKKSPSEIQRRQVSELRAGEEFLRGRAAARDAAKTAKAPRTMKQRAYDVGERAARIAKKGKGTVTPASERIAAKLGKEPIKTISPKEAREIGLARERAQMSFPRRVAGYKRARVRRRVRKGIAIGAAGLGTAGLTYGGYKMATRESMQEGLASRTYMRAAQSGVQQVGKPVQKALKDVKRQWATRGKEGLDRFVAGLRQRIREKPLTATAIAAGVPTAALATHLSTYKNRGFLVDRRKRTRESLQEQGSTMHRRAQGSRGVSSIIASTLPPAQKTAQTVVHQTAPKVDVRGELRGAAREAWKNVQSFAKKHKYAAAGVGAAGLAGAGYLALRKRARKKKAQQEIQNLVRDISTQRQYRASLESLQEKSLSTAGLTYGGPSGPKSIRNPKGPKIAKKIPKWLKPVKMESLQEQRSFARDVGEPVVSGGLAGAGSSYTLGRLAIASKARRREGRAQAALRASKQGAITDVRATTFKLERGKSAPNLPTQIAAAKKKRVKYLRTGPIPSEYGPRDVQPYTKKATKAIGERPRISQGVPAAKMTRGAMGTDQAARYKAAAKKLLTRRTLVGAGIGAGLFGSAALAARLSRGGATT
jgi:hypothetical protein